MSGFSIDQEEQIREMLAADNKIATIKLYREITGVGLAETKDAVEAIIRDKPVNLPTLSRVSDPDPFLENRQSINREIDSM